MSNVFPPLPPADLQPSLATLQIYAKLLGKIRRALTPRQKHWGHISLRLAVAGLTTTPMPAGAMTLEMILDLIRHQLVITTSRGESWTKPLRGQAAAELTEETLAALAMLGVKPEIDRALFSDTTPGIYEPEVVERYWQPPSQIDLFLKHFKG